MSQPIVEVRDLTKKYDSLMALDGVSFTIEEGEVFGLLGPNGAGKTTAIGVLTCLFPPTSGRAHIAGHDTVHHAGEVKKLIGVVPQDLALYGALSARDNLLFFGEMYGMRGRHLRQRVDEVLSYVAMSDRAGGPVNTYSGGMKRRINLAAGLIHHPRVLFLDEPTVGVDPQSRNHIFESVMRLNSEEKMTILYTTHYMEEAERLCRRVGIIDNGRIIALDTPKNLISILGGGIIQIGLSERDAKLQEAVAALPEVKAASWVSPAEEEGPADNPTLKVEAHQANAALMGIIELFNSRDVRMLSLETLEPNLESVFLHLTGKSLRQ